jgi:hypothetical protein
VKIRLADALAVHKRPARDRRYKGQLDDRLAKLYGQNDG